MTLPIIQWCDFERACVQVRFYVIRFRVKIGFKQRKNCSDNECLNLSMLFNPENNQLNLADPKSRGKFVLARYFVRYIEVYKFPGLNFGDLAMWLAMWLDSILTTPAISNVKNTALNLEVQVPNTKWSRFLGLMTEQFIEHRKS